MGADGAQLRRRHHAARGRADDASSGLHLPMAGWHNVSNALAAIAVARELGVSREAIRKGLAGFGGVKRRFTTTGVVNGVRIVDDYGHHPVEIAAVLQGRPPGRRRAGCIAVVQPHRYTRLRDLMAEFCGLLQRRRHGDRRRRLCRRRGADRGRRPRRPGRGPAPLRPPPRPAAGEPRRPAGADRRRGQAGDLVVCWAPATSPPGPTPCRAQLEALA